MFTMPCFKITCITICYYQSKMYVRTFYFFLHLEFKNIYIYKNSTYSTPFKLRIVYLSITLYNCCVIYLSLNKRYLIINIYIYTRTLSAKKLNLFYIIK